MATRRRRTTAKSEAAEPSQLAKMVEIAAEREAEAVRQAAVVPLPDLPVALPREHKPFQLPKSQNFQRRPQTRQGKRG